MNEKYHKLYWEHIQKMWNEIKEVFESRSDEFRLLVLNKRLAPYIYFCNNRETEENNVSELMKSLKETIDGQQ